MESLINGNEKVGVVEKVNFRRRKCFKKEKLKMKMEDEEKMLTDIMSPTTMSPTWTWVSIFYFSSFFTFSRRGDWRTWVIMLLRITEKVCSPSIRS